MNTGLVWSPAAHFVDGPQGTAALDSLFLRPVYLGSVFSEVKRLHADGMSPLECLRHLDAPDDARSDLLRALVEARVVRAGDDAADPAAQAAASVMENRHLTEMYLVVTGACNFACSHCLSGSDDTHTTFFKSAMDERTALRALDLFVSVMDPDRANRVVFYGGEPLLRWPLVRRVIDAVREQPSFGRGPGQIHTKLITNGSLLTHEIAEELGRAEAEVVLSFDGPDWLTRLARPGRGRAKYPELGRVVAVLREHGVAPSLSITVTDTTLAHLDAVLDWVADEVTVPVVFCIVKQQEDWLYGDVFAQEASEAMLAAYRRILAAGGEEQRLNRMIGSFRTNTPNLQSCFAQGAHQVVIDQNGRLGVCQGFLEDGKFFEANVWQPELAERLFGSRAMTYWEERLPVNIEPCRHCASVGICGGGCPASASKGGKTIYSIDAAHCRTSRRVLPFLLWEVLTEPTLRERFDLPAYASFGLDA